jgi:hypothetical protein
MSRLLGPGLSLWVAGLVGCSGGKILCAPLPPWAIAVEVRDSVTGARLTSGAKGAVFLAQTLDDSLRAEWLPHLSSDTLLVGGMTEGLVEVRIEHAGYLGWSATDVQTRLGEGDCPNWETQELVARLQMDPGS